MKPVCIIGVGNPARGDDAVGRAVAARLRNRVNDHVEVLEEDGEVSALLARLEQAETVYLIDAAAGGAPGTVHRFDAADGPLPQLLFSLSTHGFGLGEALELARALGTLPARCVIYAVEGERFEAGRPLSPAVGAAVTTVVDLILAELPVREADHA